MMPSSIAPFPHSRRGFALVELMVAFGVIAIALAIGMMALHTAGSLKRRQDRRTAAREAIEVCLERVRALDRTALPGPGKSAALALPPAIATRLPDGRCTITCEPVEGEARLLRVRLSVGWAGSDEKVEGGFLLPVEGPAEPDVSPPGIRE